MLNSKLIALILIGIILFLVYKYSIKCQKKKEFKNNYVYNYPSYTSSNDSYDVNADLKPILKINKTKHNKRVTFNLSSNEEETFNLLNHKQIEKTFDNNLIMDTTPLCQKKEVDLNESFNEKLDNIKNCKKIKNNASLKDIYDDLIVDYRKAENKKELIPVINTRQGAAFGLSSYDNSHWNYQNETVLNGGMLDNNLYANDPLLDQTAKF